MEYAQPARVNGPEKIVDSRRCVSAHAFYGAVFTMGDDLINYKVVLFFTEAFNINTTRAPRSKSLFVLIVRCKNMT